MTSMYPMPHRGRDERFDDGLIHEVGVVLELRGFPPVRTGSDLARLRQHMAAFLYDSGGAASPGGAVQGVTLTARSGSASNGAGPGTPDDWPDYAVDHPAPVGHLVLPSPHPDPAVIEYPEMLSGVYSYTALARRTR